MGHASDTPPKLVLFDGECNVCNGTVLFIIDHDPDERFVFAPLDSPLAQQHLEAHGLTAPSFDSVVLVDGDQVFTHSSAALQIAQYLGQPYSWLSRLALIPAPMRDAAYRAFARRRYRWFGQSAQCRVPTPELARRFVS